MLERASGAFETYLAEDWKVDTFVSYHVLQHSTHSTESLKEISFRVYVILSIDSLSLSLSKIVTTKRLKVELSMLVWIVRAIYRLLSSVFSMLAAALSAAV